MLPNLPQEVCWLLVACVVSAAALDVGLLAVVSTYSVVTQFTACKHGYVGCSASKVCLQPVVLIYTGPL
jgi:hypothetical protein